MTDSGPQTASGAKLYIGTTAVTASTDSFVEIAEVGELPEFGREYDVITWKPVSDRAARKFKGGYNDGDVQIMLGKDLSNAGQLALSVAADSDFDYNFKVVDNDDVPVTTATVTMATGTPGVVTDTAHGLPANSPVVFTTTGALLTGLTASTTYYVKSVIDANSYSVSATPGGAAIAFSSTQSGVHTRTTAPVGSTTYLKAKVTSFKTIRGDGSDIIKASVSLAIKSGSLSETTHLP